MDDQKLPADHRPHPSGAELIKLSYPLEQTPLRRKMGGLMMEAYTDWYDGLGEYSEKPNEFFDEIARIADLQIIEKRDYFDDYAFRCAEYAFSRILPDAASKEDEISDFWENPIATLKRWGFRVTANQHGATLVAYGHQFLCNGKKGFRIKHVGVLTGNVVQSKFDQGHIFEHSLGMVPRQYGDAAVFFTQENS